LTSSWQWVLKWLSSELWCHVAWWVDTCYLHFCGWSQVRIWPSYIGRVTQIVVNQNNEMWNGDRRYNPTIANRTGNQDQWENNAYEGQRTEMSYKDKELFCTQTAFCVFREWKRGSCDLLRWKPSSLFILLEVKPDLLSLVPYLNLAIRILHSLTLLLVAGHLNFTHTLVSLLKNTCHKCS
jgi:hypothetical protein